MENRALTCPVCTEDFDQADHIPRTISTCGHTICSKCLTSIIKGEPPARCPLDKTVFPHRGLAETFRVDVGIKTALEDRQVWELCSKHQERLRLVCFDDKTQLCDQCLDEGAHSGHTVKTVRQGQADIEYKRKELETSLRYLERYSREIDVVLNESRNVFTDIVKNKFEEIKWMLSLKENELLTGVNFFFSEQKKQISDILGVDPDLKDTIISKLLEYQSSLKFPDFYNLVEENISDITTKLNAQGLQEFMNQLNENIKDVTSVFNISLNSLNLSLSKISIPTRELSHILGSYSEERGGLSPCKKNPSSVLYKAKTVFKPKVVGETLELTTDDKDPEEKDLDSAQWRNTKNVKLTLTRAGLTYDDYLAFFHIWRNVESISSFELVCNLPAILDKPLIELMPVIFWRTSEIKTFKLDVSKCRIGDEGMTYFMKKILPKLNGLQSLDIRLWKTTITGETITAFARNNALLMKSLETFHISLRDTRIAEEHAIQLFLPMHKMKSYTLNFMETSMSDKTLGAFIKDGLPTMAKLEVFKLYLGGTKVTDTTIMSLFGALPDIKEFLLDLGNTQVTDRSMQAFKKSNLSKSKNMENFEIRVYSTNITEDGASQVYVPMENAKRVALHLGMIDISDRSLELISKVMLPPMHQLESFEIKLFSTYVGDHGVTNLLKSLKNVKEFSLDLERTQITDKFAKEFLETLLPQMTNLKKFDFRLQATRVTETTAAQIQEARVKLNPKK